MNYSHDRELSLSSFFCQLSHHSLHTRRIFGLFGCKGFLGPSDSCDRSFFASALSQGAVWPLPSSDPTILPRVSFFQDHDLRLLRRNLEISDTRPLRILRMRLIPWVDKSISIACRTISSSRRNWILSSFASIAFWSEGELNCYRAFFFWGLR